ncbi:UGT-54 protein, partial [Aphelenchoides avenae]
LKILVYQTAFGTSHVQFSGALVDVLVDRGHTVDKLLQVYNTNTLSNGTTKARRVYRINSRKPSPWPQMGHIKNPLEPLNADEWVAQFRETREIFCDELLSRSDLLEELKREKYDIGLTSIADGCSHGLFHLLGIPVTSGYVAFGWSDDVALALGIPTPPSYLPGIFDGYIGTDELTFTQRYHNLFNHYDRLKGVASAFEEEQAIFDRRFPEVPPLTELFTRMSYVFMNNNELLDMPRPQSSKVKYIGGIAMKPAKTVSGEFERILSVPSKGTVLFSFGTLVKTAKMSLEMRKAVLRAFSNFKDHTFIWKYDTAEEDAHLFRNYTNVFPVPWLPQTDLLGDSRVVAFISHMGQNSHVEAAFAGKPTIAIPLFGDQGYNAACALRNGISTTFPKSEINEERLTSALRDVLGNSRYRERARAIADMLHHLPGSPKETLVTYVEYAAKFPTLKEHLQLASAQMDLITYLCLDVIACVVFTVV